MARWFTVVFRDILLSCSHARLAVLVLILAWPSATIASNTGFRPIRALTTVSIDRSTIDVEVDATFGPGPESQFVEPRQSLHLRLERAYVTAIDRNESPADSRVVIAFDTVTGLAASLFKVPTEQFAPPADGIKQLPHKESIRRTLILHIDGADTSDALNRQSEKLRSCLASQVSDTLYSIDERVSSYCRLQSRSRRPGYIAKMPSGLLLHISCSRAAIGCRVHFPFDNFAPRVSFHVDRLNDWMKVVADADVFLRSKLYQPPRSP